jgi:effector-binding domain-containing protein
MAYEVTIQHADPRPLAVVSRQASAGELSRVVPECCGVVWQFIRAAGLKGGRHVAVYWDCSMRIEVGAEVAGPFTGDGDVHASVTPAGAVAVVTHFGPYDQMGGAHAAVQQFCQDQALEPAGPSWEIYGHWNDDPTKLRTDIFYLLKGPGSA